MSIIGPRIWTTSQGVKRAPAAQSRFGLMTKKRRQYSPEFKFKVALEAVKGRKTLSDLAGELQVHPTQISDWKRLLLEEGASVFRRNGPDLHREHEAVANGSVV